MFKRLFFILFALIGSFIILITIYRASVGIGALNLSAVVDLLGHSFSRTSEHLSEVLAHLNKAVDGVVQVSQIEMIGNSGLTKLLNGLGFVGRLFTGSVIIDVLIYFCVLVEMLLKLLVILFQDIGDVIRILGFFIIQNSPYPVNPYFPVG